VKSIKKNDFIRAMKEGWSPARLIFNHFHEYIEHPVLRPLIRTVLKVYWSDVEKYLTNVKNIYNILSENEELRDVLKRPEAIRYLNYVVAQSYVALYEFVWYDRNPFRFEN